MIKDSDVYCTGNPRDGRIPSLVSISPSHQGNGQFQSRLPQSPYLASGGMDTQSSHLQKDSGLVGLPEIDLFATRAIRQVKMFASLNRADQPEMIDSLQSQKVQSEIERVIGLAEPQVNHRKDMPYTDAVINEIQRFGNIVPTNVPHATTQDVNFRGYLLPKGTHVIPLLTSALYDKDHFVKADEFYPEHFLDSSKRSCAGENLAKMELFMFFTKLLQNFTFQAPLGATLDLNPRVGFTASPKAHKICAMPRK
ncbi:unnamed protein product [Ranitomeya imitator]|uniref:Uncharacterized protein n=1 Tax=Ranitomeya imitator TaxID=111125 RepID=A0ABN9KMG7_9NEOB|nr:unnamed protein product [Ranitomeya imitator]